MATKNRPSEEFLALLRKSGDSDIDVALPAQREFAKALDCLLYTSDAADE